MQLAALLAALISVPANSANAQGVPFSQHGEVSQRVNYTGISVSYNRPTATHRDRRRDHAGRDGDGEARSE
jgi:hypothetical protein